MQVGEFRRRILKEGLKQGNFKIRLSAVRCLGAYLDAVLFFEDTVPLQVDPLSMLSFSLNMVDSVCNRG